MKPLVIKLGGALLDDIKAIDKLFLTIHKYWQSNKRTIVIVHGGGCIVDEWMNRLALPIVKRDGLRVTPADQIDFVAGALAGTANKKLLAQAQLQHLPVVGLCLSDGESISVTQLSPELGHVGTAKPNDARLLTLLLAESYLPLISSIGISVSGALMNVNADQAATAIALLLDANLLFMANVNGVLDKQGTLLPQLTEKQIGQLIDEGTITAGMVVKVHAALVAAKALGRAVDIASWHNIEQLPILLNGTAIGTRIMS